MPLGMAFEARRNMTLRAAFSGLRSHRVPRQLNLNHSRAQPTSCATRTAFFRAGEELELAVPTKRVAIGQELERKPVVSIARPHREPRHPPLAHVIESPFLALQVGEDLPHPALSDALILTGEIWTAIRFSKRGLRSAWTCGCAGRPIPPW